LRIYPKEVKMADWQLKIKVGDLFQQFEEGTLCEKEVGKEIAKRLRTVVAEARPGILTDDLREEAIQIAEELENVDDVEHLDEMLGTLFDWGDVELPHNDELPFSMIPKLCWIEACF